MHVGQARRHWRQLFVSGNTSEHGAACRFDYVNGHSILLGVKVEKTQHVSKETPFSRDGFVKMGHREIARGTNQKSVHLFE
jgi:hypothetical protein